MVEIWAGQGEIQLDKILDRIAPQRAAIVELESRILHALAKTYPQGARNRPCAARFGTRRSRVQIPAPRLMVEMRHSPRAFSCFEWSV